MNNNNHEPTKLGDEELNDISGGFWEERVLDRAVLRCDSCAEYINSDKQSCLTTAKGQHICERCLKKYEKIMPPSVYNDYIRSLLGIQNGGEVPIPTNSKNPPS